MRGPKIEALEKGTVYVVEFWATWCGPCKESIPHLTELAKKHGDKLHVVGINVWENAPKKVPDYVAKMGERMAYSVDLVPRISKDSWTKPKEIG